MEGGGCVMWKVMGGWGVGEEEIGVFEDGGGGGVEGKRARSGGGVGEGNGEEGV